ncbi:MAG: hypothetical protein JO255_14260 [Alphaproteobacteria bacterium]|nr:hypothetical protein [Alphaproteobacteria bacterium]
MRITPLAMLTIAAVTLLAPATLRASEATEPAPGFAEDMQRAAELMRQGLNKALGSVESLLRAMPQYELPQVNENGDIIIRRKRPDGPSADPESRSI